MDYCKECGHKLPDIGNEYVIKIEGEKYYPDDYEAARRGEYTTEIDKAMKFSSYDEAYGMYYAPGPWMESKIIKLDEKQT